MAVPATDEVLLVHLARCWDENGDDSLAPYESTASGICESLGVGEAIADRMSIVSGLADLEDDGLLERRERTVDGGGERPVYRLTEAGIERASDAVSELSKTSVTVVDGNTERRTTVEAVAEEYDRSVFEIVTNLSGDGVFSPGDSTDTDGIIGRDEERRRCLETIDRVRDGEGGRAVAIVGPGGIGKTTLVTDVIDACDDSEEVEVVRTRCVESSEPYRPIRRLLAALAPAEDPFGVAGVELEDAEQVDAQRSALFYEITTALTEPDDDATRVLHLDDVHLADPGTLVYLEYLLERLGEFPLVVFCSFRADGLPDRFPEVLVSPPEPASGRESAEDTDAEAVVGISLPHLDEHETRRLIERTTGSIGAPRSLGSAVQERTGGNPMFVEQTVRMLMESKELDPEYRWYPASADEVDLPAAVVETIDRRVQALESDVVEMLRWAAVVGDSIPVAVLDAVVTQPSNRRRRVLESLVAADIFDWSEDGASVAFRGHVIRESLLEGMDQDDRRRRHETVASVLDALLATDAFERNRWTGVAAAHHEAAGQEERASELFLDAGELASDVYAHETAIEHYERAFTLAEAGGATDLAMDAMEHLGDTYRLLGEFDEAARCFQYVRTHAADRAHVQRASRKEGLCLLNRSDYEAARRRLDRALTLAQDRNDRAGQARARNDLGTVAYREAAITDATEYFEQCLSIAETLEDPELLATSHKSLGGAAIYEGDVETALSHWERALTYYEETRDVLGRADCLSNLGIAARQSGDYEDARQYYRESLQIDREVGRRWGESAALLNLGVVCSSAGEFSAAKRYFEESLEMKREIDDRQAEGMCLFNLGLLAYRSGAIDDARAHLHESLDIARAIGDRRGEMKVRCTLAEIDLLDGDGDAAMATAKSAMETAREIDDVTGEATARNVLGRVALETGALDVAESHFEASRELTSAVEDRPIALETEGYRLVVQLRRSDDESHRAALDRVLSSLLESEAYWEGANVIRWRFEVGIDDGDRRQSLCELARECFDAFDTRLGHVQDRIEEHCGDGSQMK